MAGYGDVDGNTVLFREDGSPVSDDNEAIYAVSVEAVDDIDACGSAPCFLLRAVPRNDQINDGCGTFKLSSSNRKEPDPDSSDCW